jgi:hypothetical protein
MELTHTFNHKGEIHITLPTTTTPFMVPPLPPMGTHLPTSLPQPNLVPPPVPPPPTSYTHINNGATSTYYNPYGPPHGNPYYPFPGPPQLVAPPHGKHQEGINFIQCSRLQHVQYFE